MSSRQTPAKQSFAVSIGAARLCSLISFRQGTSFVLIELAAASFFAAGVADRVAAEVGPWVLLGAVLIGVALRSVDLEACGLFIPGGVYGTAKRAFGGPASTVGASLLLVEYLVFGALAAAAAGHSLAALSGLLSRTFSPSTRLALDDVSTAVAVCVTGTTWWWLRQGRALASTLIIRIVWSGVAGLAAMALWGLMAAALRRETLGVIVAPFGGAHPSVISIVTALGACLFAAGSAEALGHASSDVPLPKIQHLRRMARFVSAQAILLTAGAAFLFVALVPESARTLWDDAPWIGLVLFAGAARWVGFVLAAGIAAVSALFLGLAVHRSASNAQRLLLRLSEDGLLVKSARALHPRFGTPSRLIDLVAVAQLAIVVTGAAQLSWLATMCGVAVACGATLKIATLVKLRTVRPEPRAFRVPFNPPLGGRERPLGLAVVAALVTVPTLLLVFSGNPPALVGLALVIGVTTVLGLSERTARAAADTTPAPEPELELLAMAAIGADHVNVRPGSVLVPVRKPGALGHLAAALQADGDRDVVIMTVRLLGVDVSDDRSERAETTDDEQRLLTSAAVLAERHGQPVRLLIVPATNVFEAVADTVVRLQSSDIYVGESETLSADDQARLLGDALEQASRPVPFDVRLVVHHGSGRLAIYHLGAHAPSLSADDLQLIHAVWVDVVKAVGPHVHHRDVVRAALTYMKEQLNTEGPERDAALDLVRRTAHPADELAAVVHQRDFARLRDMVRNRPPSDLAAVFTDLSLEDQVVTFRVLPRKTAAATFEYLSHDAQQALLRTMAQEDVAALLNDMAPDDRTMFLEELPAAATQQMLTLLTPEERSVAVTLLGYPEDSIGRLMTPDYIAVREEWSVQQVLDYVRAHGQDSETLNVIYVVDDHGVLIDDIRIREFLLTAPDHHVSDLMDRRFVALNAANDQHTAVLVFRREDRPALPVTDSAGVLIGIVTIDDVLDVAEAAATDEIQRIGGSEALEEPYMRIALGRMIQKRAGWLTALFLGEMLTATAMGAFEREIERAVVLALFVPLIISSGGNSGSQASTLVIRAIALGEVQLKDWWRVMRREIAAGLALGGILGTIGFLRITVWSTFSTLYGPHWLLVALTVGFALVGVVLWGTLVGSLLPFLLRRLGFDPATSSAPFVATLVDVTGLVIYFSVGLLVLRGTLL